MDKEDKERLQKALSLIDEGHLLIEGVRDDLQSEFDDRSESWQQGDKGQAMEEVINALGEALDAIDDLSSTVGNTMN